MGNDNQCTRHRRYSIGRTPLSVQRHGSRLAKHSAHGDEADPIGGSLKTSWKQAS
ncbi:MULTISPECIES: hypothetical protein [Halomonadaceae]|uniref:Uncharacterized protein n=2 Tax=Vreelandella TaxID=3137766 RepID=A0A7Z0RZG7_9GAMM|nr:MULTISPECIES: hypothetical protein [Halomonas]NYS79334.1 hypothetical protein [Halomonas glaciei]